jgi:tetratricopeptide (TPR) repeat protein
MIRRRRLVIVAALIAVALGLGSPPACAQGVTSPYLQIVWRYRAGDTVGAVTDAAALPTFGLRARVLRDLGAHICETLGSSRDCDALRRTAPALFRARVAPMLRVVFPAAVLLHLHTSSSLGVTGARDASELHREIVEELLDRMGPIEADLEPAESARFREFRRHAYLLVLWMLQSAIEVSDTEANLRQALRAFPGDADLLLVSGWVEETKARPAFLRDGYAVRSLSTATGGQRGWMERERTFRLTRAAAIYRQCLAARPALAEARVRLGRVLLLQNRLDEARATLTSREAAAGTPRHRYLAALFAGAVDERALRVAAARTHYEAALRAWPTGQAARVSLSRLLARDGNRAGAAALIAALPADPGRLEESADPWSWYDLGQAWQLEAAFLALLKGLHE